jgi:hypothetical protein
MPILETNIGYDSEDDYHVVTVGGTNKRVRRKCTIAGCRNRVVQGGLCITHGASRKTCRHPGCTKKVKKSGLCSSHGPARKRCEAPGCSKVAVQRGKCVAHGAKKKSCSFHDCPKQAILRGMCKKHHDLQKTLMENQNHTSDGTNAFTTKPFSTEFCCEVKKGHEEGNPSKDTLFHAVSSPKKAQRKRKQQQQQQRHKPTHTRGLSIFHDISAATVSSILNNDENATSTTTTTTNTPA